MYSGWTNGNMLQCPGGAMTSFLICLSGFGKIGGCLVRKWIYFAPAHLSLLWRYGNHGPVQVTPTACSLEVSAVPIPPPLEEWRDLMTHKPIFPFPRRRGSPFPLMHPSRFACRLREAKETFQAVLWLGFTTTLTLGSTRIGTGEIIWSTLDTSGCVWTALAQRGFDF